ncbi:LysR family transcriptional regulator [Xanthobacter sp. V4C-4]|uniref:LysR family transcriptional regulator n=1 Tax=Xanthobacter cornucopiae TaxID=3119924 RepID=UPI0037283882
MRAFRAGSLTRAAQRLGITQPAASAYIAALETMLGKPLFIRQARGVTPTPAADDLARLVAAHLDGIETTMDAAQARSSHLRGTVHIVGPAEYLSLHVAPRLAPLTGEGLRLRIQTVDRARIYATLDGGHADLAVTASPPEGRAHGYAELGRERLLPVAAPGFAERAKARSVTAELLCGLPCVAYGETLPLVREFFQWVFDKTPAMQAVATAPDLRLLREMAKAGAGWTVLPDYLCMDAVKAGQLAVLPTTGAIPENTLYLAWNKPALRHPRVVYVRDFLPGNNERGD